MDKASVKVVLDDEQEGFYNGTTSFNFDSNCPEGCTHAVRKSYST